MRLFPILFCLLMLVCGLFLYLTNRDYHIWFEEAGHVPIYESRDCTEWLNTTSSFLNYLRRLPDEHLRFVTDSYDGKKPLVYRSGKPTVGIGPTGNFLKSEGNLYAQLGDRIRIKKIGDSPLFTSVKKILQNNGLMAEATYQSGYVKLTLFDRGRMSASCNMVNGNVKCVDSTLATKSWSEVVKTSHESAIALNILCKRTPRLPKLFKSLKEESDLVCRNDTYFSLNKDVRAICPHIPEIEVK